MFFCSFSLSISRRFSPMLFKFWPNNFHASESQINQWAVYVDFTFNISESLISFSSTIWVCFIAFYDVETRWIGANRTVIRDTHTRAHTHSQKRTVFSFSKLSPVLLAEKFARTFWHAFIFYATIVYTTMYTYFYQIHSMIACVHKIVRKNTAINKNRKIYRIKYGIS